jgi:predicted outer membrane lipoprotein
VNKAIRWRIITLQSILVLVLAGASGFLIFEGNFATNMIQSELSAQQISFPTADQIKTGGALDPAEFPQEIRDQAGKQLVDGNQARIYANDFLGKHLQGVAGGSTYGNIGIKISAANAALAAASKTDPNYATLQANVATLNAQKATLFQGETLRSMLLNAYGWWTIGTYTTYAGIGLLLAAFGVLGALVFELFVAGRKPQTLKVAQKIAA